MRVVIDCNVLIAANLECRASCARTLLAEITGHLPPGLSNFDRSDRKWIATYILGDGEVLYNALDSDWRNDANAISETGINVVELCSSDLTTRH